MSMTESHARQRSNFAASLLSAGRSDEALDVLREVLEWQLGEAGLGPWHDDTLATLTRTGDAFFARRDWSAAWELYEKVFVAESERPNRQLKRGLVTANKLCNCLQEMGEPAGAYRRRQQLRGEFEREFGPSHVETLHMLNGLANDLARMGALSEAHPIMKRVFEGRRSACGDLHYDTLASQVNLANATFRLGDALAARALLRGALTKMLDLGCPDSHPYYRAARALERMIGR